MSGAIDGVKYAVKALEDILYDLSLTPRGTPNHTVGGGGVDSYDFGILKHARIFAPFRSQPKINLTNDFWTEPFARPSFP